MTWFRRHRERISFVGDEIDNIETETLLRETFTGMKVVDESEWFLRVRVLWGILYLSTRRRHRCYVDFCGVGNIDSRMDCACGW